MALQLSANRDAFDPFERPFIETFQACLLTFATRNPGLVALDASVAAGVAWIVGPAIHRGWSGRWQALN